MKKIAITMGDPAGVGPEIIVRALCSDDVRNCCAPVIVGDFAVMQQAAELVKPRFQFRRITAPAEDSSDNVFPVLDLSVGETFAQSRPTAEAGRASAAYIRKAVELAMNKQVNAIVTAPISKEALKMAGLSWPGHTEMLAELTDTKDYAMMLVGGPLRVILATIHTALRSVPDLITKERVLRTIRLASSACAMLGIRDPRIAVAGLNPHGGEAGMFGDEELHSIRPAVEEARSLGIPVSGPYPPDTIFHKAYRGETDVVVCMYHDQGLIPLKMIAFDTGVNVTVGLPIVRTSPDHGTAYDIAWKGSANPASMIEAIRLAAVLKYR